MSNNTKLLILQLLFTVLGLFVKELTYDLGVFQQVFLRMTLVAVLTSAWASKGQLALIKNRRDVLIGAIRAGLMTVVGAGCYVAAMQSSKLAIVSFLSCLPFEAAWGMLLFKEQLQRKQALGFSVSIVGIWVMHSGHMDGVNEEALIGGMLAMLSGLAWGLGVALAKYHSPSLGTRSVTLLSLWWGVVWSGAASICSKEISLLPSTPTAWSVLLGSVVVVMGASWLLNELSRTVPMTKLAVSGLMQPVLTALLAFVVLGERLSLTQCVAGMIVLGGVLICNLSWSRRMRLNFEVC